MERYIAPVFLAAFASAMSMAGVLEVEMLPGESWFGCATAMGGEMPWTEKSNAPRRDLGADSFTNQTSPVLLSDKGRRVWCDSPFSFEIGSGRIRLETAQGDPAPEIATAEDATLRGAYMETIKAHFPPAGSIPDEALFAAPQYNTWIELNYRQNQKGIEAYADGIVSNGFPPGVIMIDDTWQTDYGAWKFDAAEFPDPKGMVGKLHAAGFKVSLWVCPFVSMDSREYRALAPSGALCAGDDGSPQPVEWWNGKSAVLDMTSAAAKEWFAGRLEALQRDFGVDGFKFDAADIHFYTGRGTRLPPGCRPADQCEAYAAFGERWPLNEFRACWKSACRPLAQRLNDKSCTWEDLGRLVPDMAAAGLLGHLFVCPDMIGGGFLASFEPGVPVDQELFVRSAQIHALSPMMQFSVAPWRVLDAEHLALVKEAVALRMEHAPRIVALARECAASGEPMLRHMEYAFPGCGLADVKDQFALGGDLIVAPQTAKGAAKRTVRLPPGCWLADDGGRYDGPCEIEVATPLSRLPRFAREGAPALRPPL